MKVIQPHFNLLNKRVRLMEPLTDQYTDLVPGDEGTINFIDDYGTLNVQWDNGSMLGLIPGLDFYEILDDEEPQQKKEQKYMIQSEWSFPAIPKENILEKGKLTPQVFYEPGGPIPFPKQPELPIFGGFDVDDNAKFMIDTINDNIKNHVNAIKKACLQYGIDSGGVISLKVEKDKYTNVHTITIKKINDPGIAKAIEDL